MKMLIVTALAILASAAQAAPLKAIGVENEYADVIGQIGGADVQVTAIMSDPNTDPHTFEVSPRIAGELAGASLVVENGLGYDGWADRMVAAAPNSDRKVIDVQHLLGLPDRTFNPHLWYEPHTMPVVARAIADALAALRPAQAAVFRANLARFDASLARWTASIAAFRARFAGTPVAVTEPVADAMLQAAGCRIATPGTLQAAIMNGTDPSPQDVSAEEKLLRGHEVAAFVYNRQVTDSLTQSFLDLAKKNGVPIVGVYETMPAAGDYQSWMETEVASLRRAVESGGSTETLQASH